MNCNQFNTIPLEEVLQNLGHFPTRQNEKEAWFLNPFGRENHPSFKLNKRLNIWYLFSEGIGGNNINFMNKYLNTSISEVLAWAENQNFSSFQNQKTPNRKFENPSKTYEISEVREIGHPALLQYLKSRKVENQTEFLKEIHYQMNDKNYFGIGFKNDSDGFEIRNAYSKICLGKKDISTIENGDNYLEKEPADYLILNSVSMINKIKNEIKNYENIELYFDNDEAGNRAVEMIKNKIENADDCRILYSDFKDLNDWLIHENPLNERQVKYRRR
jgi:DNA primase